MQDAASRTPSLTQYSASLRRFGAWLPARNLVVVAGVVAMTAYTVPELRGAFGVWPGVCLWCCLGFFAADAARRVLSLSGLVDVLAIAPVEVDVEPTPIRLGVGAFLGELALLGDSIRTANVSTTKAATLSVLDLADFRKLMAHYSELARVIDPEGKRRQSENLLRRREARRVERS